MKLHLQTIRHTYIRKFNVCLACLHLLLLTVSVYCKDQTAGSCANFAFSGPCPPYGVVRLFQERLFQNFSECFPNWWHVCMRCRKYTCQCRMYTWDISWHQPTICQHILSIWRLQGMLHSSTCSKIFTKNHAVGKNTYLRLLMSSSWWMGSPPCQQIRGLGENTSS